MKPISTAARRQFLQRVSALALLGTLGAGCSSSIPGLGGTNSGEAPLSAPVGGVQTQPLAGTNLGTGPVRVALILPLTQGSGPSAIGTSLRNAAELALADVNDTSLTVLLKDDRSTPDGAREAARAALSEGAELFIGPLFANNVKEVGAVAKSGNRPVIGFSTDSSAAQPGVYLLSFLIESQVDRVVGFAADKGKKSFAAMVPESDYGNVALAEFQQMAASKGVRVMAIERYKPGGAAAAATKIAALGNQIDALFLPEQADALGAVGPALEAAGLSGKKIQILGTGVWNDARVLKQPALQGAWFAAPENAGFNAFAARYKAKYGSDPARVASLTYDAVSLAAALARTQGGQRFATSTLLSSTGFNGADGVFRFRQDGLNDRVLAVLQVGSGSASVVSPAPKSFGAGS